MASFLAIAAKYWIEFLFGLVVAGGGLFFKRYIKLEQQERAAAQKEFYIQLRKDISNEFQESVQKSKDDDKQLQEQIDVVKDEMNCLKRGLLSMQGKEFRVECARVLAEDHVLTLDEYEQLEEDHAAYNGLGGNHKGDSLFELVKKKAENTLTKVE